MALKERVVLAATVFSALIAGGCCYMLWFVDQPASFIELLGLPTFWLAVACCCFSFGCVYIDRKSIKDFVKVSSENKKSVSPEAQDFHVFGAGSKLMTANGDVTNYSQDFIVYPPEKDGSGASGEPQQENEERFFEDVP